MKFPIWTLGLWFTLVQPALAAPSTCTNRSDGDIIREGERLTTLLRIASFRADLNGMESHLGNLDGFIDSCPAVKKSLACGPACYFEQAHVFLFKASDLPYLSSSSGRGQVARLNVSAGDAMAFVNEGVRRAEIGLRMSARGRGPAAGAGGGAPSSSFKDYVNNTSMLASLIVRLKMTAGDLWYQELSQARLQHLDALVTAASSRPPANPGACASGSELCTARAFYEDALWRLIEAKSDVPATTEFAATRLALNGLESDLRTRLKSIRQGHLFLDLDPERFTSIPSGELLDVLSEMQGKLSELEGKIDSLVQGWAIEKGGHDQVQIDENRYFDAQNSTLLGHKIAKLDTESQIFAIGVEKELSQLNFGNEEWEYRRMLRLIQVDLEKKRLDTEAQKKLLETRKAGELLAINQESIHEQKSELRWLISARLTQNSLEMQIGAFESQRLEYKSRLDANKLRADQVQERINQAQLSQNIARKDQDASRERLMLLNEERTRIFTATRKAMQTSLCDIETSLGFLGEQPDSPLQDADGKLICTLPTITYTRAEFQKNVCDPGTGLRMKLSADRLESAIFLRKCVVGIAAPPPGADRDVIDRHNQIACPANLPGEYRMAQDLAAMERAVRKSNEDSLRARLMELQRYIKDFHDAILDYELWTIGREAVLGLVETAYISSTQTPSIQLSTYAAGLCSGVGTTLSPVDDLKLKLKAAYEVAKQVFAIGREKAKDDIAWTEKFGALQMQVAELDRQVQAIDLKETLAEAEAGRVIAQIMGRESAQRQDIYAAHLENLNVIEDCRNADSQMESEILRLKAEHERQSALLNAESLRNESQAHAVTIEQFRFENAQLQERIHRSQEADLGIELKQIKGDTDTLIAVDASIAQRIASTLGTKSEVEKLDADSRALNQFLADLRSDRSRLALSVESNELDRLSSIMQKDETSADAERKAIFERMASSKLSQELKDRLQNTQNSILKSVSGLRDQLLSSVSKSIDNGRGEREKSFLVTKEQLTDMQIGIPEYVRAKKSLVGAANTAMTHLRSRFKILAGLGGDAQDLREVPYIRTADELNQVMQQFCRRTSMGSRCTPQSGAPFYDERQVETYSETFVIPGSSGLARRLVRDGEAKFRVAPLSGTTVDDVRRSIEEKGFFTLWSPRFERQRNLVLTDIVVGIDYPCTTVSGDRLRIIHLGDGLLFRTLANGAGATAVPVMMSDAPRSWAVGVFDLKNGESSKYNERVLSWKGDFQMRNFPETRRNPDSTEAPLPFLGAPLLATYKLSLASGSCPIAGADIKITFAYAGKVL